MHTKWNTVELEIVEHLKKYSIICQILFCFVIFKILPKCILKIVLIKLQNCFQVEMYVYSNTAISVFCVVHLQRAFLTESEMETYEVNMQHRK